MGYDIFWAEHITKPDISETGATIILTTEMCKKLKNEGGASEAAGKVIGTRLDLALEKSKGIPLGVEVSTERCEDPDGYEVSCVVKVMGNKGWRNWFPLPIVLRREQFKEIDKMVEEVNRALKEAIEPLLLKA